MEHNNHTGKINIYWKHKSEDAEMFDQTYAKLQRLLRNTANHIVGLVESPELKRIIPIEADDETMKSFHQLEAYVGIYGDANLLVCSRGCTDATRSRSYKNGNKQKNRRD